MGSKTKIEWTDATWNPFMGCSWVSEGCRHCYAERIAGRFVSARPNGNAVTDRVWIARRVGKKNAGAMLDGREWRQFPEVG